jgi:hypothetical protein
MNGRLQCTRIPAGRIRFSAQRTAPGYLSATYSADGALLLAGGADGITIWKTESGCPAGRPVRVVNDLPYTDSLVPAGDDRVVAQSFDTATGETKLSLVRPATGIVERTLPGRSAASGQGTPPFVDAIVFLPAERAVAVLYDDRLMRLVDPDTGRQRSQVRLDARVVSAVAGPGGRTVVAAVDGGVREMTTRGRVLREFAGTVRQLLTIAQGRLLAGLRYDDGVTLWDSATGVGIGTLPVEAAARAGVVSSDDGLPDTPRTAIAGGPDGVYVVSPSAHIVHWRLGFQDWLAEACRVARRDLNAEEWTRFTGTNPPSDLRCGAPPQ